MRKIIEKCPACDGPLSVTELSCTSCDTVITGHYTPCPFCSLPAEDVAFLEVFVKNRGNVKEMERELGISYWSIRNRLDEVVEMLDFAEPVKPKQTQSAPARRQILEKLDRGEITVAEAAQQLSRSER